MCNTSNMILTLSEMSVNIFHSVGEDLITMQSDNDNLYSRAKQVGVVSQRLSILQILSNLKKRFSHIRLDGFEMWK